MSRRSYASLVALLTFVLCAFGWSLPARAMDLSRPIILVARPELVDFYHATILIVKPLGNGRHVGFIINRPTPMTLGKLFPEHAPSQKVTDPVYLGGPESVNTIFAIVQGHASPGGRSLQLTDDLFLAMEVDVVDHIIEAEAEHARFFAGMVAWQPGELQDEIQQGFWYVRDADSSLVLRKPASGLWEDLVHSSEVADDAI